MTVLLTGAAGQVGTMLRERLPGLGWTLRPADRRPLDGAIIGEANDPDFWDSACSDGSVTAIVHLGGQPTEAPWPVIRDANVEGVFQCFEAARRHGIPRVVFASSNHATGFTPRSSGELEPDGPSRPDTLYGVSKVFGEALGRYHHDRYGLAVACLRIGTCAPRPVDVRSLSTWLSPGDAARLVDACLRSPALGYSVVWGVSANTRRWWSLEAGHALGFEPQDDAEVFAGSVGEPSASDDLVGGRFTTSSFGVQP